MVGRSVKILDAVPEMDGLGMSQEGTECQDDNNQIFQKPLFHAAKIETILIFAPNFTQMKRIFLFSVLLMLFVLPMSAQDKQTHIRVAFWNMENFFDPFVDSTRAYNEFTSEGMQHWTKSRFYTKRNNMYKAILAMSENRPIGIMGLCEVENEFVLNSLFGLTPLKKHNYRWVHYEGPDRRGIDPAIVYSKDWFTLVESATIPYYNPDDTAYHSRDILYVKFIDNEDDTIHIFVNHWPSRYSGELETVGSRACAAAILRSKVDSICEVVPNAKIIIMGDLNDCPSDPSVHDVLKARGASDIEETALHNLFADKEGLGFEGTLKHQSDWQIFDQIIVTPAVIDAPSGLKYKDESARIFWTDFMLQDDDTYHGKKLFRTYIGPRYFGGFSDHLPVFIDLVK